ncbi:uncharacterized protein LOC124657588 [Lolium rigidum]|uniref:uncharacterized protein LOC124657588 n=1 Tax=Lolium rigidum TaxID=89674 RepID=UPI001F5D193A|nr:uncharacterized protein LOC124657588 [Lolium rigidum]
MVVVDVLRRPKKPAATTDDDSNPSDRDLSESLARANATAAKLISPIAELLTAPFSHFQYENVSVPGVLPNGNVAVKRIKNSHTINEKQFYREVNSLLTTSHPNIVRFLGYCASTDQTAIKLEDELRGLDWSARYQIIKGICDGLYYLHKEKRIYHMDLKPDNILLDNDMVPKITDFGLSRLDEMSQTMTVDRFGSLGYCAPEYLHSGKMSFKCDIYSLGIIITELVTGQKSIPDDNKYIVLRRWMHRWRKTGNRSPLGYQQESDPCNRPFILDIVRAINELASTNSQISNDNEFTVGQISPYLEDDMLGIEPLELHFPFEPIKEMACLLQLTNETDSYMAFEVQKMSLLPYCTEPHQGIVPPHSKFDVDITLQPQYKAPKRANEFIVRSTRVNYGFATEHITTATFNKSMGNIVDEVNLDVVFDPEVIPEFSTLLDVHPLELHFCFEPNKLVARSLDLTNNTDEKVAFVLLNKSNEETCFLHSLPTFGIVDPWTTYTLNAEELGNAVHKVTLKGVCALQGETRIEIILTDDIHSMLGQYINTIDANQTEPLILTGHSLGYLHVWNCDTQKVGNRDTSAGPSDVAETVRVDEGLVGHLLGPRSQASLGQLVQLNASCAPSASQWHFALVTVTPMGRSVQVPDGAIGKLSDIFVWCLDSPKSKHTLDDSGKVGCLDFFAHVNGQQYLITGSDDRTAKIWDMQKMECVCTLPHRSEVCSVLPHPSLPLLVTGTKDGHINFWSSSNFRLKRILHIGSLSPVKGLTRFMEPGRVVVAHEKAVAVIEINDEEHGDSSVNNENSVSSTD